MKSACIPKCWKSNETSSSLPASTPLSSEEIKTCTSCQTSQSVAKDASVFICTNCHAVNRANIVVQGAVVVETSAQPPIDLSQAITLRRVNSSTFLPLSDAPGASDKGISAKSPVGISPCSICLDAPGDMMFLSCNHGGFCEACANLIASNGAVGGACCVKCRAAILKLGRIVEVNNDSVKAVQVDLPNSANTKSAPPKVPPPRGFNKSKKK